MYQCEAMWISFASNQSSAVKVSIGGINALTGMAQHSESNGKQDYLAINSKNGQL